MYKKSITGRQKVAKFICFFTNDESRHLKDAENKTRSNVNAIADIVSVIKHFRIKLHFFASVVRI